MYMNTTDRIELDLAIRKHAIDIASAYGVEGVEYFQKEFHPIAKEYAEELSKERTNLEYSFQEEK